MKKQVARVMSALISVVMLLELSGCGRTAAPQEISSSPSSLSSPSSEPEWQPVDYHYNDGALMPQFADELTVQEKAAIPRIADAVEAGEESVEIPEAADYDSFIKIWYTYTRSYPQRTLVDTADFADGVATFTYLKSHEVVLSRMVEWREKVEKVIIENVSAEYTDAQAAFVIYKYLVTTTEYCYEALDDPAVMDDLSGMELLLDGRGICNDYAQAFSFFMRQLGIECLEVESENHVWNLIQLDGCWYHVDATFENTDYCSARDTANGGYFMGGYFGMSDDLRRESCDEEWVIMTGQDSEMRKPAPECPQSLELSEHILSEQLESDIM